MFTKIVLSFSQEIYKLTGTIISAAIVDHVYHWVIENFLNQRTQYFVDGCFWTHSTKQELLDKFGVERRTFDKNMKKLIELGLIIKKKDFSNSKVIWLTLGPAFVECAEFVDDKYFMENCAESCVYPANKSAFACEYQVDKSASPVDRNGALGTKFPTGEQSSLQLGTKFPTEGTKFPTAFSGAAPVAAPRPVDKTQRRITKSLHIKDIQLTDPATTTKGDLSTAQKNSLSSDQDRQIAKLTMKQKAELAASEIFDATTKAPSNFGFNEKDPNMINRIYSLAGRLCILPKKLRPFFKHYTACEIWIQLNNLKYAEKMNDIKNPVGWLSAALEKNYDTCEAAFDFYQSYKLLAEKEMRERI